RKIGRLDQVSRNLQDCQQMAARDSFATTGPARKMTLEKTSDEISESARFQGMCSSASVKGHHRPGTSEPALWAHRSGFQWPRVYEEPPFGGSRDPLVHPLRREGVR